MANAEFNPGFRFSMLDAVILLAGAGLTATLTLTDFWVAAAVGFVIVHFFLFCNIVRMSRPFELTWAACFVVLAALAILDWISWALTLGIAVGVSIVLVVIELRAPSYHGIGWHVINPSLPAWWDKKGGERPS